MNTPKDNLQTARVTREDVTPEDYERIRAVFEPMKEKFARLAASLPADARPALRFEAKSSGKLERS